MTQHRFAFPLGFDSLVDSDNNGNALDDPDYIGSRVDIIFESVGTNTVIVTVFDASNNSDSHTFYVIVSEAEVAETDYGIFAAILFLGVVTVSIAMIGYRRWQGTIALKLLTDRGLPENEARAHISMVKQTQRLPLFAKAVQIAGLSKVEPMSSLNKSKKQHARRQNFNRSMALRTSLKRCLRHSLHHECKCLKPPVRRQTRLQRCSLMTSLRPFLSKPLQTISMNCWNHKPKRVRNQSAAGIELPEPATPSNEEPPAQMEELLQRKTQQMSIC